MYAPPQSSILLVMSDKLTPVSPEPIIRIVMLAILAELEGFWYVKAVEPFSPGVKL